MEALTEREPRAKPETLRTEIQVQNNCCNDELSTAYLLTEEEVDESSFPLDYISLRILIY